MEGFTDSQIEKCTDRQKRGGIITQKEVYTRDRRKDVQTNRKEDEEKDKWKDVQIYTRMDVKTNRRKDEQMEGCTDIHKEGSSDRHK